ncbi:MAG: serine protease [Chitinophagaceae bacterium]|jgi:S1-C subfamily serine protease|nr:serine protease [Chitinophagaceae bacterium]MCU0403591.1 serine protease [Chitinophagaceae bacterium]
MEDLGMFDLVERYLNGEMSVQEKEQFELLRRQNAELDQFVVEQQMFLSNLKHYGEHREMKHKLQHLHNHLVETGAITESAEEEKLAPVVRFWQKNKRTIAVAASIATITALSITGIMQALAPKGHQSYLQQLNRKMSQLEGVQKEQNKKINKLIDSSENASKSPDLEQISGGTSFLIDGDGYLVTNSHVVQNASTLIVVNKGKEYIAKKVYDNQKTDLAILKITDADWKSFSKLPYDIRKGVVDLGEEIFTLGYPRNEVVYNRGYMSARSGYQDDTLSIQLSISANPGNSGGPVLDKNGSIVGILSTRDRQANDVVFASKAVNISKAIEELREDTAHKSLNTPSYSAIKGVDRVQQIKKIQDCVFMVKGY